MKMGTRSNRLAAITIALSAFLAPAMAAEVNQKAIDEVRAGTRSTAYAAWWGFDPVESTNALQAAIDSGAKKVIVQDMGSPWIVDKISLASNQEIVFEKRVVVLAKKGAFMGKGDSLFSAVLKHDVALIGHGARLTMRRADYDHAPYEHAEWRHVLTIKSCTNVRIEGLTLSESGGDGIYLGKAKKGVTNTNVTIRNVVCDRNYRQGISVITAKNLLIENCVFSNTDGTSPRAGIDFEPNASDECLVNCTMRNCLAVDNRGAAYVFYLPNLSGDSEPISIRLENCRSQGTSLVSFGFVTSNTNPVKGTMDVVDCTFADLGTAGVNLRNKPATACRVRFVNCLFADPSPKPKRPALFMFGARRKCRHDIGGVEFVNCRVRERVQRPLMSFQDYAGGICVFDVTGTLTVDRPDKTETITLTKELLDQWMPGRRFKQIKVFDMRGMKLVPAAGEPKAAAKAYVPVMRGKTTYVLYANKGDAVELLVRHRQIGHYSGRAIPVTVTGPSGAKVAETKAEFQQDTPFSFTAPKTGVFTISCEPPRNTVTIACATHALCLEAKDGPIHFVRPRGDFYFYVPAGVEQFGVKVFGEGSGERVKATVFDASGKQVWKQDNIAMPELFVGKRPAGAPGEVWRLRLGRPSGFAFEDCYADLTGVPALLATSRAGVLKPAQ